MTTKFTDVFIDAQRNALAFLKSEFSFREVERIVVDTVGTQNVFGQVSYAEAPTWFKSKKLERFVTLCVAPLRLELDLDIGIGKDRKTKYSIYELHSLELGHDEFPIRQHNLYEAMHDVQQLEAEFEVLAQVLRTCGSRFFAADMKLWEELSKQRAAMAAVRDDILASRNAEKAFSAKEWDKVVNLLEPRERRLSKVDAAKLAYARKHRGIVT